MKQQVSETRKNYYRSWMLERKIDLELSKVDEKEINKDILESLGLKSSDPSPLATCHVRDFDKDVHPGDIRLLSDDHTVKSDCSFSYVCILNVFDGFAIVAPFSKYANPATSAEWATGSESKQLRVLQLWNAQPFPISEMERTWKCMTMPEEMLNRAMHLYECSVKGVLPKDREDIGLQILSENDIRNDYLVEDFQKYAPLHLAREKVLKYREFMAMIKETVASKKNLIRSLRGWTEETEPSDYSEIFSTPAALAAASLDGAQSASFTVEGFECEIKFDYSQDENVYKVNVCEASSGDFTDKLDHFKLMDYYGREIVEIGKSCSGFCEIPADNFEGEFCLVDNNGNAIELK